ncbi:recombinase family protein [Brevibacillus porteri]|nr:recombinase family protein [Brevibacillus porteri]MED1801993.1 recombinase family protein [Brevibacillus porteri]MED2132554.1 recombinase family protein [Brevibacillus porteri]MED2745434.1 recombinase family protein [Brevibacillus porteri]MED2814289.1 recombinase family protein [Brevibacillus porteri]MED2892538.1 recombinase family protein [Brevibacillus porteri]
MKVAYVRVSTTEQNEERQVKALESHQIEKWFIEKVSGKDRNRPQLQALFDFVREGDTIYIESISRLARSTYDFLSIVRECEAKGVQLVSLKESIDTSTPQGKFMLTIFGALYELERENIKQRQAEGIEVALNNGVKFGRPKQAITADFTKAYKDWKAGQITATEAMKRLNMKPNTFYRRVKEYEHKA